MGLRSWKALDFKKWGGSSLRALQKFTPMRLATTDMPQNVTHCQPNPQLRII